MSPLWWNKNPKVGQKYHQFILSKYNKFITKTSCNTAYTPWSYSYRWMSWNTVSKRMTQIPSMLQTRSNTIWKARTENSFQRNEIRRQDIPTLTITWNRFSNCMVAFCLLVAKSKKFNILQERISKSKVKIFFRTSFTIEIDMALQSDSRFGQAVGSLDFF